MFRAALATARAHEAAPRKTVQALLYSKRAAVVVRHKGYR